MNHAGLVRSHVAPGRRPEGRRLVQPPVPLDRGLFFGGRWSPLDRPLEEVLDRGVCGIGCRHVFGDTAALATGGRELVALGLVIAPRSREVLVGRGRGFRRFGPLGPRRLPHRFGRLGRSLGGCPRSCRGSRHGLFGFRRRFLGHRLLRFRSRRLVDRGLVRVGDRLDLPQLSQDADGRIFDGLLDLDDPGLVVAHGPTDLLELGQDADARVLHARLEGRDPSLVLLAVLLLLTRRRRPAIDPQVGGTEAEDRERENHDDDRGHFVPGNPNPPCGEPRLDPSPHTAPTFPIGLPRQCRACLETKRFVTFFLSFVKFQTRIPFSATLP